ncbi:JAB domain-containing protein [Sphingomonas parva]|nr:JAB domain-containing protein [Sphingomonas parva]
MKVIATAEDAAQLLAATWPDGAAETIAVLHLDSEGRMLGRSEHPGDADAVDLPLRAIIAEALRLDASGMIVAHNHPSGDPTPSSEDVEATRILAETARRLDIRLVDHLIFGGDGCSSFRALGLL